MEHIVDVMVEQMVKSYHEMARILVNQRRVAVQAAHGIHSLPDAGLTVRGAEDVSEQAMKITKSITGYLNSLSDLQDALTDHIKVVMGELQERDEGE